MLQQKKLVAGKPNSILFAISIDVVKDDVILPPNVFSGGSNVSN